MREAMMGFMLDGKAFDRFLAGLRAEYEVYAPRRFPQGAGFSDLDLVRYGPVDGIGEVVFDSKSANSPKEALHPPSQPLFYFTENEVGEAKAREKKPLVFMRSCDIHGLKRLDEVMLGNGEADFFYRRIREKTRIVLMPCRDAFENCFCVDMQANKSEDYDFSVEKKDGGYLVDVRDEDMAGLFRASGAAETEISVPFVAETGTHVNIAGKLEGRTARELSALPFWDEYDLRCIACGRCTFGCPSCSCWSMQDMYYSDNGRAGERRRVWASCMVDGYSDMAGGASYRKKAGQRMRYKVLHKIVDHAKRFGHPMCSGCGRCDDVCPEYISFSNSVNRLGSALDSAGGGGKS